MTNGDESHDEAQSRSVGIALGFTAYVLWGLLTLYWKVLKEFDPFELIGWRIASSVVILAAVVVFAGRTKTLLAALRNTSLMGRIAVASALLTANWTLYVWAVVNEHVIETALGYFIAPLFTILIGVIVLRERLRTNLKVAVGFAVAGLSVLTISYGRIPWVAISIAGTWSIYGYLKKKVPLKPLESLTAEVLVIAIPAIGYVVATWSRPDSIANNANVLEVVFALLTGVITAVPLLLFAGASQRTPLTILGPMQYLVPTINFVIGWAIFGEAVSGTRFAGFALIWVCLGFVIADVLATQRNVRLATD
jgi:chloramphenicol-sensitive protein RarD